MNNNSIDFVVLWVDCNDPVWQQKKAKYSSNNDKTDNSVRRYRDWDLLRYWFRGVEKFAPWVRKIHFVTDDQIPEWLDLDNPKLNHVRHSDYIPNDFLPLFNSSAIEVGVHNIKGLSDQFVFFNDDVFLVSEITPEYYFKDGLPIDTPGLAKYSQDPASGVFANILRNDLHLIRQRFSMADVYKSFFAWFRPTYGKTFLRTVRHMAHRQIPGFVIPHLSTPYEKSTWEHVWAIYGEALRDTQQHRFRSKEDASHFIFRFWRLCEGSFAPRRILGKYISLNDWKSISFASEVIQKQKVPEICLNDCWEEDDHQAAQAVLIKAFEQILPEKCSFEK